MKKNLLLVLMLVLVVVSGVSCSVTTEPEPDVIIYDDDVVTNLMSPSDGDYFAGLTIWQSYYRSFGVASDYSLVMFRDTEIGEIEVQHLYPRSTFGADWGIGNYFLDPELYSTEASTPDGGWLGLALVNSAGTYPELSKLKISEASFYIEALEEFPNTASPIWSYLWDSPTSGNEIRFDGLTLFERAVTANFSIGHTDDGEAYILHSSWDDIMYLQDLMESFLDEWNDISITYVIGALEYKGYLFVMFEHEEGVAVLELKTKEVVRYGQD